MKNQASLFDYFDTKQTRKRYGRTIHGGAKTSGHRKLERPLSTRKWLHLILKSDKARGELSFLQAKNQTYIQKLIQSKAKKFGIKVAQQANVGTHLHLKIKISSRENFQKFLKSLTTLIARFVTGAKKGKPFGKFWQGLAFTRVLCSAKENWILDGYIAANRMEANEGRLQREVFLSQFQNWLYKERARSKSLGRVEKPSNELDFEFIS